MSVSQAAEPVGDLHGASGNEPRPAPNLLLPRWPLARWLLASHFFVLVLPAAALLVSGALTQDLVGQTREDLLHQAHIVSLIAAVRADDGGGAFAPEEPQLSATLLRIRERTLAGFRILDTRGRVVATSGSGLGSEHLDDPAVLDALSGLPAEKLVPRTGGRNWTTLRDPERRGGDQRLWVVVPIETGGRIVGAVVVNRTPREALQALIQWAPRGWLALGAAWLLTGGLALYAAHRLARTLRLVDRVSQRIAAGELRAAEVLGEADRSHVTEAADLARSVARMAARIETRLRYATELAGNVSHELKTPLSSVKASVELVIDDEEMSAADRRRLLEGADRELDRAARALSALLRLARAEETPAAEAVDLDEILARIAGRREEVGIAGRAGTVFGTGALLEAALDNLVDNAVRHGGPGPVRVVAELVGPSISVEDSGPGISPTNRSHIFDRFFTTARERGGTGLGLSFALAVARSHGARIEVESEPGRTCFRWTWATDIPRGAVGDSR